VSKTLGSNINVSDEAFTSLAIPIDSTTAVDLALPRNKAEPHRRITIFNAGNKVLWLRFYPAGIDNLFIGEPLLPGDTLKLELPNMPTGGISGIMASGGARDVYVQYI
jgi:hypothetical protein